MSVLIYTEIAKGKVKKSSLEAVNYGSRIAAQLNTTATAVIVGDADLADLGKAGATKVLKLKNDKLTNFDGQYLTAAIEQVVSAEGATIIIFAHDFTGKEVAPRLAAKLKAGIVAGAVDNRRGGTDRGSDDTRLHDRSQCCDRADRRSDRRRYCRSH